MKFFSWENGTWSWKTLNRKLKNTAAVVLVMCFQVFVAVAFSAEKRRIPFFHFFLFIVHFPSISTIEQYYVHLFYSYTFIRALQEKRGRSAETAAKQCDDIKSTLLVCDCKWYCFSCCCCCHWMQLSPSLALFHSPFMGVDKKCC